MVFIKRVSAVNPVQRQKNAHEPFTLVTSLKSFE